MPEKSFQFFVPVSFEKAQKDDGREVMRLKGVASTSDEDMDKEILEPAGFDLSYFESNGVINWNHIKTPDGVIGEPLKAKVVDNKLELYVDLYPDRKLARDAYELQQSFEKNSKTRTLGFSIEGIPLERDPENPKRITKTIITGCALTQRPTNPKTFAEIAKSLGSGENIEPFVYPEEDLEIFSPTGAPTEKDQIAWIAKAIHKLGLNKLFTKDKQEFTQEETHVVVDLNKSQIFDYVYSTYGNVTLDEAYSFYNLTNKISKIMELDKTLS